MAPVADRQPQASALKKVSEFGDDPLASSSPFGSVALYAGDPIQTSMLHEAFQTDHARRKSILALDQAARWSCNMTNIMNGQMRSSPFIVALTGCTSGIGLATALELARRDVRLLLIARNAERCAEVARRVAAAGAPAPRVLVADSPNCVWSGRSRPSSTTSRSTGWRTWPP